jgi:hypothetical protein
MKTKERLEFERAQKIQRLIDIRLNKQMDIPEKFIIPQPESGEKETDYINRCMAAIGGEYDTPEQAVAVCYAQLKK